MAADHTRGARLRDMVRRGRNAPSDAELLKRGMKGSDASDALKGSLGVKISLDGFPITCTSGSNPSRHRPRRSRASSRRWPPASASGSPSTSLRSIELAPPSWRSTMPSRRCRPAARCGNGMPCSRRRGASTRRCATRPSSRLRRPRCWRSWRDGQTHREPSLQLFVNRSKLRSLGMDHEDASGGFLPALRSSYARLAAWMTRGNRLPEPSRLPAPTRMERPARIHIAPRSPTPPRL